MGENKVKEFFNMTYKIANGIVSVIESFFFIGCGILLIMAVLGNLD